MCQLDTYHPTFHNIPDKSTSTETYLLAIYHIPPQSFTPLGLISNTLQNPQGTHFEEEKKNISD